MQIIELILLGILVLMIWERLENSSWLYRKKKWGKKKVIKFQSWYTNQERGDQ